MNPFVGYRSVTTSSQRFATESIGVWDDRNFFDSIVQKQKTKMSLKDALKGPKAGQ